MSLSNLFPLSDFSMVSDPQQDLISRSRLAEVIVDDPYAARMFGKSLQHIRKMLEAQGVADTDIVRRFLYQHPETLTVKTANEGLRGAFGAYTPSKRLVEILPGGDELPEIGKRVMAHETWHGAQDFAGRLNEAFPGLAYTPAGDKRMLDYPPRHKPGELGPHWIGEGLGQREIDATVQDRGSFLNAIHEWFGGRK